MKFGGVQTFRPWQAVRERLCVHRLRLRSGANFSNLGEEGKLNQSLVNKCFVSVNEWRHNSLANHLRGEEWKLEGSASGLIRGKQWAGEGLSMSLI